MGIKKSILLRVRIAFLCVSIFALVIIGKLVNIQFIHNEKWIEKAENTNIRQMDIKATRGNIYSDNGSLMATSLPFYTLAFDPSISLIDEKREHIFKQEVDSLCIMLSSFFKDRSAKKYKQLIYNARGKGRRYLRISNKQINHHEKKIMSTWPLFRHGQMNGGVIFEKINKRFIPFGHLARRTVGYCRMEKTPEGLDKLRGAGLEYSFDSLLRGTNGQALFAKISGGGWKPLHTEEEIKPQHGYDIETTLDVNLQDVAEETLHDALVKHEADNGCVVVMEVATGEIKAIANLSRIKSGRLEGSYVENFNHAVGTNVEPGSTIKIASMIALFEETNLELSDSVYVGNGTHKFYDRTMTDSHAEKEKLSVQEVLEISSNVGTAKLVTEHFGQNLQDQQRFINYFADLGFKHKLHFQIDGEKSPSLKSPEDKSWSGISLPWMSIGYGLEASPLHVLSLYNGIANNGKLIQPIIVKRIRYANKVYEEYQAQVINKKICSDKTLAKIQTMLEGVVERGTARGIKNTQYKIAGKTGTAKKLKNGVYMKNYLSSFCGYFPAENPKYSAIVVIDNPTKAGFYGSQTAAPVFRSIADKVYARDLELHKLPKYSPSDPNIFPVVQSGKYEDLHYLCQELEVSNWGDETLINDYVTARRNDELRTIQWKSIPEKENVVPDVGGMRLRDALFILENLGLKVQFDGSGRVQTQSVNPGKKVLVGSSIKLTLA